MFTTSFLYFHNLIIPIATNKPNAVTASLSASTSVQKTTTKLLNNACALVTARLNIWINQVSFHPSTSEFSSLMLFAFLYHLAWAINSPKLQKSILAVCQHHFQVPCKMLNLVLWEGALISINSSSFNFMFSP